MGDGAGAAVEDSDGVSHAVLGSDQGSYSLRATQADGRDGAIDATQAAPGAHIAAPFGEAPHAPAHAARPGSGNAAACIAGLLCGGAPQPEPATGAATPAGWGGTGGGGGGGATDLGGAAGLFHVASPGLPSASTL